jgi:diguanylate cyclase (GGDEF)-like protein/PAS domain S-box-containing protein
MKADPGDGREAGVVEVVDALPPADRRSAFANAPMGVALTTPEGVLVDANPALCSMLGRTAEELYGRSVLDQLHPDAASAAREAHAALVATRTRPMRHETRLLHSDGTDLPVQVTASWVEATAEGQPAHLVMIVEDITERKALEAQLVHRSLHDPLTGLPNRLLFQDRLWHALERGRREDTPTCVLITDLDGFKAINDELGHPMGDLVLVAFAERLRSVLRASDTAARLGGDEFSIVCENTEPADAEILADRLRTTVTEPLSLSGTQVQVGLSIGIGSVPGGEEPGSVYERVVREADDAMYRDKERRRGPRRGTAAAEPPGDGAGSS